MHCDDAAQQALESGRIALAHESARADFSGQGPLHHAIKTTDVALVEVAFDFQFEHVCKSDLDVFIRQLRLAQVRVLQAVDVAVAVCPMAVGL